MLLGAHSNPLILSQLKACQTTGELSVELATTLRQIADRAFANPQRQHLLEAYPDLTSEAFAQLCRAWPKFNTEKSDNPFAFFTQCAICAGLWFVNKERKRTQHEVWH